ncbi:MFS transporter [Saccharopolyspora soli]|uniref:MFS transporter n=1 Tax=Saccharopolyspora soli TaxID=2926618 RepID=UPI0027DEE923|nr:MFS transporter [Saccharopolyspora soli]
MSSDSAMDETTENSGINSLPREIWILVFGSFIVAIGMGIVAPALPTFATSFDVGVTAASFVISAFALMRLAFAPVSGRLVSLFGERSIYLCGITIVGVSTAACAFAGSYWQLLIFRALGGTGSTMFTVSAVALLVRLAPPHLRGRASGMWATSFLLGNISGPIIGGFVIGYSLRLPFISYGIVLFVAAFIGWLLLRKSTLAARQADPSAPAMTVRQALRHRAYWAALLSNFSNGWAVNGVRVALVPLFVIEVLHAAQSMAGAALSVFAVGNGAVLLLSGRIADRRGRKPMVLIGLAISGAATAALGFADSVPWFLGTSLVAGIGAGILNPAHNAAVADIVGASGKGGPMLAVFQMSADFGAILGPLIAGVLADTISYRAAFLVTGFTAAVGLLAWSGAPETRLTRAVSVRRTETLDEAA